MRFFFSFFAFFVFITPKNLALAKLNVLTTTTTLKSIVQSIGGNFIKVHSITKGPQDPHFVEAKPSYMIQVRRADLVVSVGLDLEIGWLPNILRGAKHPKILKGRIGHLETGTLIDPIEVPVEKVDRSQGDLHAKGNPHFTLDPARILIVAEGISKRLETLDPKNKQHYIRNVSLFKERIQSKISDWKQRIINSKIKHIVTYHKTLNYFLKQFHLNLLGTIEPKPGIPPTAKHILFLINEIKKKKATCILVESYFETRAIEKIKKSVPVYSETVATEVNAIKQTQNYEALIENLVLAIETCSRHTFRKRINS